MSERLAVDCVRASQAILDYHIEVTLVLLGDGLQIILLVRDLSVEDVDRGGKSLDLDILGEQR